MLIDVFDMFDRQTERQVVTRITVVLGKPALTLSMSEWWMLPLLVQLVITYFIGQERGRLTADVM